MDVDALIYAARVDSEKSSIDFLQLMQNAQNIIKS